VTEQRSLDKDLVSNSQWTCGPQVEVNLLITRPCNAQAALDREHRGLGRWVHAAYVVTPEGGAARDRSRRGAIRTDHQGVAPPPAALACQTLRKTLVVPWANLGAGFNGVGHREFLWTCWMPSMGISAALWAPFPLNASLFQSQWLQAW
jgi:hypothetical protein